ncbi:MAG: sigma 54-interacting transcriptional regulator [Bryobacteraceae bacterium]|nr:sigma 54-interacting transcriptional regulator [Bryobacteraceae bacterium]
MDRRVDVFEFLGMKAIVASDALRDALHKAARIAGSEASVLITGESGSGKELVARAIHHFSCRSDRPWVDLNCAALPESLVESELFGYEKGAFSGAANSKAGLFEMAHTGTLFLDEIGELDARVQVKLLRILDGTPYFRVGGTRKVSVDVRIVAATNQNLLHLMEEGRFRKDLYFRLSQVVLEVPPLRSRPDDIEALALHFLTRQRPGMTLSPKALEQLRSYSWPGNIRELKNLMTRLALENEDSHVGSIQFAPSREFGDGSGSPSSLEEIERDAIFRALEASGGNQTKAAAMLGISIRTISRKLKSYSQSPDHYQQAI